MLKDEYPRLFDHDPHYQARARAFSAKVRDIHDFAFDYGFQPSRSLEMTVTYAESCHLRNVLRVTAPPRELLRRTPGLRYVPLRGDHCCGSAGIYNLVYPDMADELLTRKVKSIAESGADVVAVSNTGCHLHLLRGIRKAGLKCRVMHTTEILSLACRSDGSDRAERGKV